MKQLTFPVVSQINTQEQRPLRSLLVSFSVNHDKDKPGQVNSKGLKDTKTRQQDSYQTNEVTNEGCRVICGGTLVRKTDCKL